MPNKKINTNSLGNSVLPWIGKTSKFMSMYMKEGFAEHGVDLTKEQFILLKTLHEKDGVKQKDLAFVTERNKGSLARLVSTMEKKNYLARIPSMEDRRVNRIHLTVNGKKVFAKIQPFLIKHIEKAQEGLTEDEIRITIAVLQKIQKNISK